MNEGLSSRSCVYSLMLGSWSCVVFVEGHLYSRLKRPRLSSCIFVPAVVRTFKLRTSHKQHVQMV